MRQGMRTGTGEIFGVRVRSKVWIEVDGEPVFGRGRRFLLEAIATHGSINRAAREIDISYRKAWSYVKAMEDRLGVPLVERRKGGRNGGGAVLTPEAKRFLRQFAALEDRIRQFTDKEYAAIYSPAALERE